MGIALQLCVRDWNSSRFVMKGRDNHRVAVAAVGTWWFSNVAVPTLALYYAWAARRDERSGLPYTAAMEWRKAADLFDPRTRIAEYLWRQWERIMGLPRRLAGPFDLSAEAAVAQERPSMDQPRVIIAPKDQVFLPIAA